MTLATLLWISGGIALVTVALMAVNLLVFRRIPKAKADPLPPLSVLIPARNEEARIEATLRALMRSEGADLEIVVLDDQSDDRTAEIVRALAAEDPRISLAEAPPLPEGWSGKQHACHVLSGLARHDLLVFLDADVRLSPDALPRMVRCFEKSGRDLVSGFPLEETGSFLERLVIPQIHFLLLGYLPILPGRLINSAAFAAGCGQLFMTRRQAYRKAGGHAAIRQSKHDGITLPRAYRKAGCKTDIFDASDLARCRMYEGAGEVWTGFSKNATEGMATPVALPIWTLLLFGGQVLPFLLLLFVLLAGGGAELLGASLALSALVIAQRLLLAWRFRQSVLGALLHPLGVLVVLAIQWWALLGALRGRRTEWRDRTYGST